MTAKFKAECAKCNGKGEIKAFSGIAGGICFCCNGKGFVELKNAPNRSKSFAITAICKENGDREVVFHIKAKSEMDAVKKAVIQLSRGNAYIPETADIGA